MGMAPLIQTRFNDIFQIMPCDLFCHLGRVELYVKIFCLNIIANDFFEIRAEDCLRFGSAAFFHDIGKLWIARPILEKPVALSPDELAVMQKHPLYAKSILESLKPDDRALYDQGFFALATAAALCHHERWDGAGYPFGIRGTDIPLIARITAICDAFDTITHGRAYCGRRSVNTAFDEIEKCANAQFDPLLVKLFVQNKDPITEALWIWTDAQNKTAHSESEASQPCIAAYSSPGAIHRTDLHTSAKKPCKSYGIR